MSNSMGCTTYSSNSSCPGKRWLLFSVIWFACDQLSKWWILQNLSWHQVKPLFPGIQLTLSYNRGVAFSWFHSQPQRGTQLLLAVVVVITLLIATWLVRTPREKQWEGWSLCFILGGALGNLFDRFWHGHVIDFIDLSFRQYHFYTFNIADAFITVGALMLLKEVFKRESS